MNLVYIIYTVLFMYTVIDIFQVEATDAALLALIENYCWEAGVRNLHQHIERM